jgi:hypothetical protein
MTQSDFLALLTKYGDFNDIAKVLSKMNINDAVKEALLLSDAAHALANKNAMFNHIDQILFDLYNQLININNKNISIVYIENKFSVNIL